MAQPIKYNLPNINKGATWSFEFKRKNPDKTPINLTGYTAAMHCRAEIDDVSKLFELTTENGGIEIIPLEGKVVLKLTAQQTKLLEGSGGVYDLELYYGEVVYRYMQGRVKFTPEVTR